jgi:hypothetical protein
LPASFVSALGALQSDAYEDRELAAVLANRPEAWVPTGIGL